MAKETSVNAFIGTIADFQAENNLVLSHINKSDLMKQALLVIDLQNDYFKNGKMELVGPDQALDKNKAAKNILTRKTYRLFMYNILTHHKRVSFKKIQMGFYFILNSVLAVIH